MRFTAKKAASVQLQLLDGIISYLLTVFVVLCDPEIVTVLCDRYAGTVACKLIISRIFISVSIW